VPGSDALIEASKKRTADAVGKTPVKCLRALGKKGESTKATASWGKTSLKRPSDAEVASARLVKLSKKTVPHPAVAVTTTHIAIGASDPKGAACVSGSKGAASAKKVVAPVQK
jgi:hypothetical protein